MIRVQFIDYSGSKCITFSGHACYSDSGEDIVCSAVSALAYTLLGYIEERYADSVKSETDDGYMCIKWTGGHDDAVECILKGLWQIENEYPENLLIDRVTSQDEWWHGHGEAKLGHIDLRF